MNPASNPQPSNIYLNQTLSDTDMRTALFAGDILIFSQLQSARSLCEAALNVARETFDTDEPELAYHHLTPPEFARLTETAKRRFTNGLEAKQLIRAFAVELGLNPNSYYFDVPRLRVVPNYDFLHAGVSYAYAPHRDPWYGGPQYQINTWMPVLPIKPDEGMALYPSYFHQPVTNTSETFDFERWVNVERAKAVENIAVETRVHPLPLEELDRAAEVRFAGNTANMMMFCGHHLHATIPNRSDRTRFSIDFRLFHADDISTNGNGPPKAPANIDSRATSVDFGVSTLLSLDTFDRFGEGAATR